MASASTSTPTTHGHTPVFGLRSTRISVTARLFDWCQGMSAPRLTGSQIAFRPRVVRPLRAAGATGAGVPRAEPATQEET